MLGSPEMFLSEIVNEIVRPWVLSIGIAGVACQLCAFVQVEQKTISKGRRWAKATCYDESTGKLTGSHTSRTSVLISPDGRYRAYAENEAVASQATNPGGAGCQNTSTLFVAGPESKNFRIVLVIKPLPERHGNDIEIVDWSPTGHQLLLAQGWWEWGSDVGGTTVRTYDADSRNLSSESRVDDGFRSYVGKACAAVFQAVGFVPSGKAVVTAEPFFEYGEDNPSQDSCVRKKGIWLVDFAIPDVKHLPDNYKVQHYGKDAPLSRSDISSPK
jgi:hypothetical protein